MTTRLAFVLATVAAAAAAAQGAAAMPLQRVHVSSPCPPPPATYKPVPFNSLSWNWEIGQWTAACGLGQLEGPHKLAAMIHLSSSDPHTIATRYATAYINAAVLKIHTSKVIADRIGLSRVQNLVVAGMLAGFRLRGRP